MFNDQVNVYINSKNRSANETVSNFDVSIPDDLIRLYDKNEYWTLNVNFFSCFNRWYNCMEKISMMNLSSFIMTIVVSKHK
jgi:hypothetical protein